MRNLNLNDLNYYLQSGELTKPFLSGKFVYDRVMLDYNNKIKQNLNANIIQSIFNWIAHNVKYLEDVTLRTQLKFQRTAKEIWEDKTATGCTDYAILFATFARQMGIPTTFLHTAEVGWVKRLVNNTDYRLHYGHSFCECFVNNEWVLVDPTLKKIESSYNLNLIELSYLVNGSKKFLPYFRGLDLGKKQTIKEHNRDMDIKCYQLFKEQLKQ